MRLLQTTTGTRSSTPTFFGGLTPLLCMHPSLRGRGQGGVGVWVFPSLLVM